MIRSMTGFARRECKGSWGTLICELRTVNHRYLEISLRLPDELKALDNDMRRIIAGALRRGKVDAGLFLKSAAGAQRSLDLDPALLDALLDHIERLRTRLKDPAPVDPVDLLRWPGLIREADIDVQPVLTASQELLREALQELNETRQREGRRIQELLLSRCAAMREQVEAVKLRRPEVIRRMRERVVEKISQLGITTDNERLEQELVLYVHKLDVDEELDRLAGHLDEVTSVLNADQPAGRRLDFLMQELNREANTLSSKSQDSETTKAAVDMKVFIEQMREQVQNIE
ncbi:hypothetical protein ACG33_14535 [Steroidobacter denitrificans]|uniref:YicC family protein n=1 Tax=Steroidobacter denitrificans TaxID=465721 RepID=A0A127FD02_STEDE|nr:YicC/YloC family endoribonuclease [Steroidobacter denitrificans]AMN48294.1 hypothetical protein ACG33_14535 [Steroidobacter denitrificans]